MTEKSFGPRLYLRTFGAPHLLDDQIPVKLRAKDLALLVYLRLEPGIHRRTTLAGLLWAEHSEHDARHSLTQAVGRLRKVLGTGAIVTTKETVEWVGKLECDAALLEEAERRDQPGLLEFYAGEFLAGLNLGEGAHAFERWASERLENYRDRAADLLDRWSAAAGERGDWPAALRLAQRQIEIDEYGESGHRRVMRAFDAMGQRNRALLHYAQYAAHVRRKLELEPQAETTALAEALRSSAPPTMPEADPSLSAAPDPGGSAVTGATLPEPEAGHPARRRWLVTGAVAAGLMLAWLVTRTRLHL